MTLKKIINQKFFDDFTIKKCCGSDLLRFRYRFRLQIRNRIQTMSSRVFQKKFELAKSCLFNFRNGKDFQKVAISILILNFFYLCILFYCML
jgi:hypothetical protein